MSLEAMTWAFTVEADIKPTSVVVLLALANHARPHQNDPRYTCWPSHKMLMKSTKIKARNTLKAYLKELENAGLIKIETRKRSNGSYDNNLYVLSMGKPLGGQDEEDQSGSNNDQPLAEINFPIDRAGQKLTEGGSSSGGRVGQLSDSPNLKEPITKPNPHSPQNGCDKEKAKNIFFDKVASYRITHEVPKTVSKVTVSPEWKPEAEYITELAELFDVDRETVLQEAEAFARFYHKPKQGGRKWRVYSPMAIFVNWLSTRHQKNELAPKKWVFDPSQPDCWRRLLGPVYSMNNPNKISFMADHLRNNWVFKNIPIHKVGPNPWEYWNGLIPLEIHDEYALWRWHGKPQEESVKYG